MQLVERRQQDEQREQTGHRYRPLTAKEVDEADIATWLPLEYDLQYTYGKDDMRFSPVLMKLREEVDRVTTEKIRDAKHGV